MAKSNLIGRKREQQLLQSLLESNEAEFLAVYGRRRVGKTFLIREFFEPQTAFFELVGQKDAPLTQQLESFCVAFEKRFGGGRLPQPASWREAFKILSEAVDASRDKQKQVLFLTKRHGWLVPGPVLFRLSITFGMLGQSKTEKSSLLFVVPPPPGCLKSLFTTGGDCTTASPAAFSFFHLIWRKPRNI